MGEKALSQVTIRVFGAVDPSGRLDVSSLRERMGDSKYEAELMQGCKWEVLEKMGWEVKAMRLIWGGGTR